MIYEGIYNDLEAVYLENDNIRVVVLPRLGGKIASIYHKDSSFELVFQNKDEQFKIPGLYDEYSNNNVCGFDDAFPTIEPCTVNIEGKEIKYPDHGEVWSSNMNYNFDENNLYLNFKSRILPYTYEKTITMHRKGLNISYNITNTGEFDFPCIWAAHYLVNCDEDMEISLPGDISEVVNVKKSAVLGDKEKIHPFPVTMNEEGKILRLDRVAPEDEQNNEKYYVMHEIRKGKCSIYYDNKDIKYKMKFDKKVLPYVGISLAEGERGFNYNCALMPCNGFYDNIDIALQNGKLYTLKKNQSLEFQVYVTLK